MKFSAAKIILFGLLLCLGASLKGQMSTDQTVCILPNTPEMGHWACTGIASDRCYCQAPPKFWSIPGATSSLPEHTPKPSKSYHTCINGACSELPVDVPAIQEKRPKCDENDTAASCWYKMGDSQSGEFLKTHWTCSDPHNYALLTSVDGEIHTCHRISQ